MKGLNSVCQVKSPLWFSNPIPHSSEPDTGEPDLVDPVILLEPLPGAQLHLLVLQQAFVEQLLDDFVIQVLSNEDQLLASVSPFPCLMITVEIKNLTTFSGKYLSALLGQGLQDLGFTWGAFPEVFQLTQPGPVRFYPEDVDLLLPFILLYFYPAQITCKVLS